MPQYSLGKLIKEARERRNLTQDELSNGICASQTLSKIETNVRPPNQKVAVKLLERLGFPSRLYNLDIEEENSKKLEIERILYYKLAHNDLDFDTLLEQYKESGETLDMLESQVYLMFSAIQKEADKEQPCIVLDLYVQALKQTMPSFELDANTYPKVMTFDELALLTRIANTDYTVGNTERALTRMIYVYNHYIEEKIDPLEASYHIPDILFKISIWEGEVGNAQGQIDFAKKGLEFCSKNNRNIRFDELTYSLACGFAQQGNMELAKLAFDKAFSIMDAFEHIELKKYYMELAKNRFFDLEFS